MNRTSNILAVIWILSSVIIMTIGILSIANNRDYGVSLYVLGKLLLIVPAVIICLVVFFIEFSKILQDFARGKKRKHSYHPVKKEETGEGSGEITV